MDDELTRILTRLRRDRSNRWPDSTGRGAPHKPLLLLALAQLAEEGLLTGDRVPTDGPLLSDLADCFGNLWDVVLPGRRPTFYQPFWHLTRDGIWRLIDHAGGEVAVRGGLKSWSQLQQQVREAQMHEHLVVTLQRQDCREALRSCLLTSYFDTTAAERLRHAIDDLRQARRYGQQLLSDGRAGETALGYAITLPAPVRDAGFRRAVIQTYDHRCATCGVRVLTAERFSLVEAAHIRAWADNHDDRPCNGLALCPTCHRCFDRELLRIRPRDCLIICSKELAEAGNIPAHLQSLDGRPLFPPTKADHVPDPDCLDWRWRQSA